MMRTHLSALVLAALTACAAPKLYSENHDQLEKSHAALVAGQNEQATERLSEMVADLKPVAKDYPLQLYYASSELAMAQVQCSLGQPFLPAGRDAIQAHELAQKAHLVAALWWTHFGQALQKKAEGSKATLDGVDLIPADMATVDVETTSMRFELIELYVNSRLGFQSRVDAILGRYPELSRYDTAAALQTSTGVPDGVVAWMNWALFENLADRDPIEAYRFGVAARSSGAEALGRDRGEHIVQWIVNHPRYEWRSGADHAFDPGRDRCPETGEPNSEFVAYPKGG